MGVLFYSEVNTFGVIYFAGDGGVYCYAPLCRKLSGDYDVSDFEGIESA